MNDLNSRFQVWYKKISTLLNIQSDSRDTPIYLRIRTLNIQQTALKSQSSCFGLKLNFKYEEQTVNFKICLYKLSNLHEKTFFQIIPTASKTKICNNHKNHTT